MEEGRIFFLFNNMLNTLFIWQCFQDIFNNGYLGIKNIYFKDKNTVVLSYARSETLAKKNRKLKRKKKKKIGI